VDLERGQNMIYQAIEVAVKAHSNQVRKGTDIPYISHPFAAGMILSQAGCSEEVIAAGILHDTIEDTPVTLDLIREKFGEKVASLVKACSEPDKSLSWEERKKHTIEFLRTAPLDVRLVACADKLHNIRCIADDYRRIGDKIWQRFKRGKDKQEWYYRSLAEVLGDQIDNQEKIAIFLQFKEEVEKLFGKANRKI